MIATAQHVLFLDLLGILAGIGCIVSSGLTLVVRVFHSHITARNWTSIYVQIFFPRSIEGEMTRKEQKRTRQNLRSRTHETQSVEPRSYISIMPSKTDLDQFDGSSPGTQPNASLSAVSGLLAYEVVAPRGLDRLPSMQATLKDMGRPGGSASLQPNRRNQAGDVELGAVLSVGELIRARSLRDRNVNSLVHHWRSPIGACVALSEWVLMVLMLAGPSFHSVGV